MVRFIGCKKFNLPSSTESVLFRLLPSIVIYERDLFVTRTFERENPNKQDPIIFVLIAVFENLKAIIITFSVSFFQGLIL